MSTANTVAIGISAVSLGLSGWASLTAHRGSVWQRKRDEETRLTRVQLEFVHSGWPATAGGGILASDAGAPSSGLATIFYSVALLIINVGETTEYISAAFLEQWGQPENHSGLRIFGNEGHELFDPYELRPRARLSVPVDLEPDSIEWMRCGFTAAVWLASGVKLRSDVEHLVPELLGEST
jgi:hypothetical protein